MPSWHLRTINCLPKVCFILSYKLLCSIGYYIVRQKQIIYYLLYTLMCCALFPGLLEKCFNAFYDSEVVSEEAFEEWVNSKDPEEQEGKGVCITSVQSFMRWLKEADEEG